MKAALVNIVDKLCWVIDNKEVGYVDGTKLERKKYWSSLISRPTSCGEKEEGATSLRGLGEQVFVSSLISKLTSCGEEEKGATSIYFSN